MVKFNELFQTQVNAGASQVLTYEEMQDAIAATSTAQVEVIESRVESLVKAIVKDGQLWIAPTVAMINGEPTVYNVSGRHRSEAAREICERYVVNAKGKVVPADKVGESDDYEEIEFALDCNVITVPDKVALNAVILAFNGSRSVTAFEKLVSRSDAGIATPAEDVKYSFSVELYNAISPYVRITMQTCTAIATSVLAMAGTAAKYATIEQLQELAAHFGEAVKANPTGVPSNFARNFKEWSTPIAETQVTGIDKEGDEYDTTLIEEWSSRLAKPTKAKKGSKTEQLAAQLAALQAQLAQLGVQPAV